MACCQAPSPDPEADSAPDPAPTVSAPGADRQNDDSPAAACAVTADSLAVHDDWLATGIPVEQLTPAGWDPARHPTLIFMHGDNTAPSQYHCYRELLAACCVRSIYPRQPTTKRSQLEALSWDQRFIRWSNLVGIYEKVAAEQEPSRIFIGGHSIGAYTALLAAGAKSAIDGERARNCKPGRCRPLPAAGYISISGWPAQSARKRKPFWFSKDAFEALSPNRYVAYGTRDNGRADPCLLRQPPTCRGDAYQVDADRAEQLNLRLDVVEGFEHFHFMCNADWRVSHQQPAKMRDFVERLADWIATTNADQASRPPVSG